MGGDVTTSSRAIEVVGPAGSGKSTVVDCLATSGNVRVVASVTPTTSARRRAIAVAGAAPRLLRLAIRGRLPRRHIAWVARLGAFRMLVDSGGSEHVVLDQGPLYTLGRLAGARPSSAGDRWHDDRIREWAQRLDAVVVLDAPDPVLVSRINRRAKSHAVKGSDETAALAAVARQRDDLDRVVSAVAACGLEVLRFDTGSIAAADIARTVIERVLGPCADTTHDTTYDTTHDTTHDTMELR